MNKSITNHISNYLSFCRENKRLDPKTIKAYKIDLTQFAANMPIAVVEDITSEILQKFIANLHQKYKPKTVKRKIASLKAFVSFLDETELISHNPFAKIHTKFREPVQLPMTISTNNYISCLAIHQATFSYSVSFAFFIRTKGITLSS